MYLFCTEYTTFYCKYDFPTNTERLLLVYGYLPFPEFYHYYGATRRKISRDAFPRDSCRFSVRIHWRAPSPLSVFWDRRLISSLYRLLIPFPLYRLSIFPQPIKYHVLKRYFAWKYSVYRIENVRKTLYLIFLDLVLKK